MPKNGDLLDLMDSWMTKTASIGDNVDDNTQPVKTGPRSSENSSDIKDKVPSSVDGASTPSPTASATGPGGTKVLESLGVTGPETGQNVPTTKSKAEDPGTSHPAKVGTEKNASISECLASYNSLLADIAIVTSEAAKQIEKAAAAKLAEKTAAEKTASVQNPNLPVQPQTTVPATPASPAAPVQSEKTASEKTAAEKTAEDDSARQLGFKMGQFLAQTFQKAAADENAQINQYVEQQTYELVKRAQDTAVKTVQFLKGFSKQAEGELPPDPMAMGGGAPPAPTDVPPAAPPAAPPMDAGGMGGAPAPGGDPAAAGGGTADPAAVQAVLQALQEEGITPEMIAQLTGGEASPDDLLGVAQMLVEQGVTPEMVHQLAQQDAAGGGGAPGGAPGGGMPPEAGGAPPAAPAAPPAAPEAPAAPEPESQPEETEKSAAVLKIANAIEAIRRSTKEKK